MPKTERQPVTQQDPFPLVSFVYEFFMWNVGGQVQIEARQDLSLQLMDHSPQCFALVETICRPRILGPAKKSFGFGFVSKERMSIEVLGW